jgi:hypothetical protein
MDLPVGMPIKEGMDTDNANFRKLFPALGEHSMTGYMALNIITNNGIEEGIVLFQSGDVVAAEYTYLAKGQTVKGTDALVVFMNSCLGNGRFDIYELTADELRESLEKNKDAVFRKKPTQADLLGLLPDHFTERVLGGPAPMIRAETVRTAGGVSREDILKKYNITHPDEKALDKMLDGIMMV